MRLKHVPNALCYVRLGMVPALWVLALLAPDAKVLFAVLLAFAFFTDQIDGYICRKYDLSTPFGAKLDRVSDDLLTVNTAAWLYVLRPEVYRDYWPILCGLLLGFALSIGLQYARFGRKIPFHLYAGKLSNWVIAVFALYTIILDPALWIVAVLGIIVGYALIEEIILVTTRKDLDEDVTSMFARHAREADGD